MLAGFLYKAYTNTRQVKFNKVDLDISDCNDQTKQLLNVLQISDMHLENISVLPEQLYEKLKDQKIDLIALTGDFLDRKDSIPKLIPYLKVLNRLQAKHGIYAVFGNHDYVLKGQDFTLLKNTLDRYGCRTMQNEYDVIRINGKSLHIIGIDDFSTKRSNIAESFEGIKEHEGYTLVLTHDPNIVLNMKNVHYDYLLSGHFHGGQIHWPKPYHLVKMGQLVQMNMIKGLHIYHGKPFYISEGLGQTGINIRVGSRPELTLHQLAV
ncbi:metallophosphoesterase [Paenibacillus larvae]